MFTYHLFPYFMYQSEQRHLKQCMCLLVHFAENLSVGHGRKIFNRHKTLRMPVFHLFHSVATIFPVGMKVKPHRICEHQLSARTIEYFSYRIRNPVPKIPAPICPVRNLEYHRIAFTIIWRMNIYPVKCHIPPVIAEYIHS